MGTEPNAPTDRLLRDIAVLRDRMLTVHYYEESHWLAASVAFPHLCHSPHAQDALRRAATIAWQFGFPAVSHWLNAKLQPDSHPQSDGAEADKPARLTASARFGIG